MQQGFLLSKKTKCILKAQYFILDKALRKGFYKVTVFAVLLEK